VKDIVVAWTARAEKATVRLQVEVELDRMSDVRVNDCTSDAVLRAVRFVRVRGEEPNVVALANDDDGNFRVNFERLASIW
jgi:hypothetical protein